MRGWQQGLRWRRGAAGLAGAILLAGCGSTAVPTGAHLRGSHRAAVAAASTTTTTTPEATTSSAAPAPATTSTTASATQPVLGADWSSNQQGWGEVRPSEVFNGGDPTGLVQDISWSDWGGNQATGTGTSTDDTNADSVADAPQHQATIVAFDPGTCNGTYMYQAVEWYFPIDGQAFDPANYENVCIGSYVGPKNGDGGVAPQATYPPCTDAALQAGLTSGDLPITDAGSVDQHACDGNFAWAGIQTGGYTNHILFLAHGQQWETAAQETYCPAAVPTKIEQDACNAN